MSITISPMIIAAHRADRIRTIKFATQKRLAVLAARQAPCQRIVAPTPVKTYVPGSIGSASSEPIDISPRSSSAQSTRSSRSTQSSACSCNSEVSSVSTIFEDFARSILANHQSPQC